jgi:hypothetical protein
MYARAVDEAATRLRDLRREELEDLGLGLVALALSLAASRFYPPLAIPLFVGGLAIGGLGVRALWRRWDLVDRLSVEQEAFVIPEVLASASRATTMARRRAVAASLRIYLGSETGDLGPLADELDALASKLDDEDLALEPAAAVACSRLVDELAGISLGEPKAPPDQLWLRVQEITEGFEHG